MKKEKDWIPEKKKGEGVLAYMARVKKEIKESQSIISDSRRLSPREFTKKHAMRAKNAQKNKEK